MRTIITHHAVNDGKHWKIYRHLGGMKNKKGYMMHVSFLLLFTERLWPCCVVYLFLFFDTC
jgi:hypothetical protein